MALLAALHSGSVRDATTAVEAASFQPAGPGARRLEPEPDAHRVQVRQRQVAMGKNTLGYEVYRLRVPLERRGLRDPATPDASSAHSQRGWSEAVKSWRRAMHREDPSGRAGSGGGGGGEGSGGEDEGGADEAVLTLSDGRRRARVLDESGRGALLLRLAYGDAERGCVGWVAEGLFEGGGSGETAGSGGGGGGGQKRARGEEGAPRRPALPLRPPAEPLAVVHPNWRVVAHSSRAAFAADPFALAPGPGSQLLPAPAAVVAPSAPPPPLQGCAAGSTRWDELAGGAGAAFRVRWDVALHVVPPELRASGQGVDCALADWARRDLRPTLPPQAR
jgi:hypothetical protein